MVSIGLVIFSILFGVLVGYYIFKLQMKRLSTKALNIIKNSKHIPEEFKKDIINFDAHLSEGLDHPKSDEELLQGKEEEVSIPPASSQPPQPTETKEEKK